MKQPSNTSHVARALVLLTLLMAAASLHPGCDDASPGAADDAPVEPELVSGEDAGLDTRPSTDGDTGPPSDVPVDIDMVALDAGDTGAPSDVGHDTSELGSVDTVDTTVSDTVDAVDVDAEADVEPPPPPHFTLTCDPPPTGVTAEVVQGWLQQREAQFATAGHPASADLQGLPGALHGALRVDFDHAARLDSNADYVYVTNAVVDGHGTGTLELQPREPMQWAGKEIVFERFSATGPTAQDVLIDPVGGLRVSGELPVTAGEVPNLRANTADMGVAHEHPATPGLPGAVGELVVDDLYTRQMFYADGSRASVPQDPMAQPVIVVAPGGTGLYPWPSGYDDYELEFEGAPTLPGAMSVYVTDDDLFSAAGDFAGGALEVPDVGFSGPVSALFGRGGALRYDDAGVLVSEGTFQLTQAIDAAGPLLPAHLELAPTELVVEVSQGEERIVTIAYREASFEGDALLGAVDFTTDAPDDTILFELSARTEWFRWTQYAIFGNDPLWAKPVLLVAGVIVDTIESVGTVLGCVFSFGFACDFPDAPDLERFPGHIPAGEVGSFDVLIRGNGEVGSQYTATLTYTGQNFCAATTTFAIEVTAPCSVSAEDFCTASGAACGSVTGTDTCGLDRTEICGGCASGQVCDQNQCCSPWSNAELCDERGADCGSLTATDNCGTQRTVDCGGCPTLFSCGSDNTCGL